MPSKKPTRVEKTVAAKKPLRLTGAIGPKATLIVLACVMAGGILVAARQHSQPLLTTTPRMEAVPMPNPPVKNAPASNAGAAAPTRMSSSPATTTTATAAAASVTITGCLERDGDSFRLKDASGAEMPKARSWKSGFLKKKPAAIDVVDPTHTLNLTDQVGRRVSVTGAIADREMTARSLRRVAASCSAR